VYITTNQPQHRYHLLSNPLLKRPARKHLDARPSARNKRKMISSPLRYPSQITNKNATQLKKKKKSNNR
jgi:hypothetical protein